MNHSAEPDRDDRVTRRDFVRGRFWRVVKSSSTPVRTANRHRVRVMRYPRTLGEVLTSDERADGQPVQTNAANAPSPWQPQVAAPSPTPEDSPAARRRTIPLFRPPGAVDEESFLSGCTRCDECRKACPHGAIVHAPLQMREAAGTPMIQADHQACMMCEDFPCIAACEPDVLTASVPPIMGTAKVTEHLCLAYHGQQCTTCSDQCPVAGAISLADGKPTVDETTCTGCGQCRAVCPAPENAVLLMPAFLRPSHPHRDAP